MNTAKPGNETGLRAADEGATPPADTGHRKPADGARAAWHRRARRALGYSIQLRLVLVFLLLAMGVTFVFVSGAQKAFSVGWREAARPLLSDYVSHLADDIAPPGQPPSIERASALVSRLPITVRIEGPQVNWKSHPEQPPAERHDRFGPGRASLDGQGSRERSTIRDGGGLHDGTESWSRLLSRDTADGHRIEFGLDALALERRPRLVGYVLTGLLLLTLAAFLFVRRLLRPLADIRAGAQRFGAGEFEQPIPVRHAHKPDELGQLAATINAMGRDIHQMLEAKRALLLAISHELRSPLTRARLNAELLPESSEVRTQREALLRDLQEMAGLITDLLESERLATRHAALQREPVQIEALAREVIAELQTRHPVAGTITLQVAHDLPMLSLDAARVRLLLRNLLDNALRHGAGAPQPPQVQLSAADGPGQGVQIEVRDYGPGVSDEQLARLAEAFYRPDKARSRHAGGVGLGLYLCRLVAQAHGGSFTVRNARPGLAVRVILPGQAA